MLLQIHKPFREMPKDIDAVPSWQVIDVIIMTSMAN
jgi:hypothetical protein